MVGGEQFVEGGLRRLRGGRGGEGEQRQKCGKDANHRTVSLTPRFRETRRVRAPASTKIGRGSTSRVFT